MHANPFIVYFVMHANLFIVYFVMYFTMSELSIRDKGSWDLYHDEPGLSHPYRNNEKNKRNCYFRVWTLKYTFSVCKAEATQIPIMY